MRVNGPLLRRSTSITAPNRPQATSMEEFEQTLLDLPEPDKPDPVPGRTTVSVTGLVTYADCPKRYFWSEVDRLPRRPGPAARRGTALHRRIELHNRGMVPFDELEDDLYDRSPDEGLPKPEGTGGGWKAFLGSPYATRTPIHVEIPFELRLSDDTWIRGRVDAVYPHGDRGWEIVDFKSGRRSNRASNDVQLQAYAVAADETGLGAAAPESLRVSFVYLGGGLEVVDQDVDAALAGTGSEPHPRARRGHPRRPVRAHAFHSMPHLRLPQLLRGRQAVPRLPILRGCGRRLLEPDGHLRQLHDSSCAAGRRHMYSVTSRRGWVDARSGTPTSTQPQCGFARPSETGPGVAMPVRAKRLSYRWWPWSWSRPA